MEHQKAFYDNLNEMLNICVFSEGQINNNDLLEFADKYKKQYAMIRQLLDTNLKLHILCAKLQDNKYYKKKMRQNQEKRRLMTMEQKAISDKYTHCYYCDNIIKRTYLDTHLMSKCCSDNQLKKEFTKKHYPVHQKHNKTTQVVNYFIRKWLYDTNNKRNNLRNGMYWKTIELLKIYKLD